MPGLTGKPDFLASKGYKRLYETHTEDGPWYECIPVSRILGKAPLLPDWEQPDGKDPCIPSWAANKQATCFPHGNRKKSKIYYVNPLGFRFGRTGSL